MFTSKCCIKYTEQYYSIDTVIRSIPFVLPFRGSFKIVLFFLHSFWNRLLAFKWSKFKCVLLSWVFYGNSRSSNSNSFTMLQGQRILTNFIRESITVQLTFCFTGWIQSNKYIRCWFNISKAAESKAAKQEVSWTK